MGKILVIGASCSLVVIWFILGRKESAAGRCLGATRRERLEKRFEVISGFGRPNNYEPKTSFVASGG